MIVTVRTRATSHTGVDGLRILMMCDVSAAVVPAEVNVFMALVQFQHVPQRFIHTNSIQPTPHLSLYTQPFCKLPGTTAASDASGGPNSPSGSQA